MTRFRRRIRTPTILLGVGIAAGLLTSFAWAASPSPGVRCAVAKLMAASRKHDAKLRCHQRAILRGQAVDPGCLAAAEARFVAAFAKAETRGGCATAGDTAGLEVEVDNCVTVLADLLPPHTTTSTTATTAPVTTVTTSSSTTSTTSVSHACSPIFTSCGGCPTCLCYGLPEFGPNGICVVPFAGGGQCGIDPPIGCPDGQVCVVTSLLPFVQFQCVVPCP